jgi:hypothetical protein
MFLCKIALHSLSREKEQNLVLDNCWRGTLAFKTREVTKYVIFVFKFYRAAFLI